MFQKIRARLAKTIVGTGPGSPGFFVRYDYAGTVDGSVPTYHEVETQFEHSRSDFESLISDFSATLPDLKQAIKLGAIPWELNGMFPPMDVIAAYHIVRTLKPSRIVEIGSGASTHVLSRAISENGHGGLTCIDPQPRRSIDSLGAKIERRVLNYEDTRLVENLAPNDILFIDSSHIFLEGMDVDIQFNRMFPKLPVGTIVHVHDIFLPEGYPKDWKHRYYAEQSALIGWILSGFFEVVYPSYYAATRLRSYLSHAIGDLLPDQPERNAGSIWLRRRDPGI